MTEEQIFEILEEADAKQIDKYLDAVLNRKRELYPDWDMFCFSLPKNDFAERVRLLRWVCVPTDDRSKGNELTDLIDMLVLVAIKESGEEMAGLYADEAIKRSIELNPEWSVEKLVREYDPKMVDARLKLVKALLGENTLSEIL